MNLERILSPPAEWMERISPIDAHHECARILPYLHGDVVEVFCRSGRLGAYLQGEGVSWSGYDVDADILEHAFLRGIFSVSCALLPPKESCDVLFGAFAPFSYLSPEEVQSFVQGVHLALRAHGRALFELWKEPTAEEGGPIMDSYDGSEKLVRACIPRKEGRKAIFEMDWMVAQSNKEPFYTKYREERFLHFERDIEECFALYFERIQVADLLGRRWLIAEKD
jgi:hypothetical protein